ncbi:hypothetical protein OPAG_05875 [Rhodococcus opacus PD630]|nr:hypothetical protein Pd630_LPD05234 [Rhodococcus opacus PD630]EHI42432.1 hypothetical protein OPAG_05875 [Rhodococcus opacus PD630]
MAALHPRVGRRRVAADAAAVPLFEPGTVTGGPNRTLRQSAAYFPAEIPDHSTSWRLPRF